MRILFVALFMVLATHVSAQEPQGVSVKSPSVEEQGAGKRQAEDEAANQFSLPIRVVESPKDAQRSRYREDKSDANQEKDLIEQRRSADAATRSAASSERQENFTIAQVAIGSIGTILVLFALGIAFQSNRIARDTGRDQSRAYVHVDAAELTWGNSRGERPSVTFRAVNTGVTPARWFSARVRIFVSELDASGLDTCDFDFGLVNFADAKWVRWNALGASGEGLTFSVAGEGDLKKITADYGRDDVAIQAVGTIKYETFFGEIFESDFWFTRRPIPEFMFKSVGRTSDGFARFGVPEDPRALQRAACDLRAYARVK